MKSVLISIQPYYVFLIIAQIRGWDIPQKKTVEVRKDFPKDNARNRRVHIYCSKNRKSFNRIPKQYQPIMANLLGKVIGEFVCDRTDKMSPDFNPITKQFFYNNDWENIDWNSDDHCLSADEINDYGKNKILYGWHISDLKIYDTPKELGEFVRRGFPNCEECAYVPLGMSPAEFVWHNNFCGECRRLSWEKKSMKATHFRKRLTRPPQSWQYVEEL